MAGRHSARGLAPETPEWFDGGTAQRAEPRRGWEAGAWADDVYPAHDVYPAENLYPADDLYPATHVYLADDVYPAGHAYPADDAWRRDPFPAADDPYWRREGAANKYSHSSYPAADTWYDSAPVEEDAWSTAEIPRRRAAPATTRSASRRRRPAHRVSLRASSVMAIGVGLAIATPVLLRIPGTTLSLDSHRGSGNDAALPPTVPSTSPVPPSSTVPPSSAGGTVGAAANGGPTTARPTSAARHTTQQPSTQPTQPTQPMQPTLTTPAAAAAPSPLPSSSADAPPAASASKSPVVQLSPDQAAAFEDQVITLTNVQRTANGCGVLHLDARLRTAAIGHSVDMRARSYFAHNTPDGVTPWSRIAAQGYASPSAENIAMGQQTPQQVVDAWMASPGHRANILNCSSKAIGVGVQFGASGPWWTQDFGYV